jgi:hypothetical protein
MGARKRRELVDETTAVSRQVAARHHASFDLSVARGPLVPNRESVRPRRRDLSRGARVTRTVTGRAARP